MVQQITKQEDQPVNESAAVISMIERVALDPNADIGKLEQMICLQERILNRNAQQAFSADMAAMQNKLPRVARNGKSHNGKYALLEDINDSVRPALQEYGFGVTFRVEQNGLEWVKITTILQHRQGHHEQTEIVLPLDKSGNKTATQSVGSTISYGKRYGICALLNISTGDDVDGGVPTQASQPQPEIKTKQLIADERLTKAIERINAGEYSVQRLNATFELSKAQIERVQREAAIDGGAQ